MKYHGREGEAPALLAALQGAWRLHRDIRDLRDGRDGAFAGRAVFDTDGKGGLAYAETGWLTLAGAPPMRAERRHLWRAEGARVVVTFEDGRPFHAFDPADPQARHPCGADLYAVRYRFALPEGWEAAWRVTGPAKSYEMISRYRR